MAGRFQGFAQEGLNFLQQVCIENDKAGSMSTALSTKEAF